MKANMFVFKAIKEGKVDKILRWTWMFLEVRYFFLYLSHTISLCSLNLNRALWSITIRSKSQNLKFIFCQLIKPGDIST